MALTKEDVLALNTAHVLRINSKVCLMLSPNTTAFALAQIKIFAVVFNTRSLRVEMADGRAPNRTHDLPLTKIKVPKSDF